MGKSYSTDHIAEDHIHTDTTCNIDRSTALERSIIDYWGGGGGGGGA